MAAFPEEEVKSINRNRTFLTLLTVLAAVTSGAVTDVSVPLAGTCSSILTHVTHAKVFLCWTT